MARRLRAHGWLPILLLPMAILVSTRPLSERRSLVLADSTATTVGLGVVVSAGSMWEMSGESGLVRLAAEAVLEEIAPQLSVLGVDARVESDASTVHYKFVMPPESWPIAGELFFETLFTGRVGDGAVERARRRLLAAREIQAGVFTSEVRQGLAAALHGEESRWARPAMGQATTLETLGTNDVRGVLRSRFQPSRTAAVVAGAVDPLGAHVVLRTALGGGTLPILAPVPPVLRPGQLYLERSTITTWIALSFPFSDDVEPEAVRLLATWLDDQLRPSAARPDVFASSTEIRRHGAGGTLDVYLVVSPERPGHWRRRVRDLIAEAGRSPLEDRAFEALKRRHLGRRLLDLAAPEDRAIDAARQLFFDRRYTPPTEVIAALGAEDLQHAASGLKSPAEAVLGPRPNE